jgi:alpha-mannosidase
MIRYLAVMSLSLCASRVMAAPNPVPEPSRPWVVYLVQHTHTDVGYTRAQSEMLPEHLRFIDEALDYCDLTDDYPDDAKFRWTCEAAWTVREYLARRPTAQIERLKQRVRQGRTEITGMFANMSEIATEASLAASLQPIREFKDAGIPVTSVMQNDVNGAAWCLIDYFQPADVKYLIMGINKTRSLLPFDMPTAFWWESPAGRRVLAFRAPHYHTGNLLKINEGIDVFRAGLLKYLRELEDKHYPCDRIAIQYSGYWIDNSPPATGECDLVKAWNAKYDRPHLRMATASEFMDYVATHDADKLPVYRQAWPDWWTDGFGSAARETAVSRETHADMLATQGLRAMAVMAHVPEPTTANGRAMTVQDSATLYDEHTFGSSVSVSDPTTESTVVQWGQKGAYAWEAVKQAGLLREEAIGALQVIIPRGTEPTVVVFNTLNWTRSGSTQVFIDHELLGKGVKAEFIDIQTGRPAPAQPIYDRPEGGYWTVWAADVPPLGYKVYRIRRGQGLRPPYPSSVPAAEIVENSWYRLAIDAKTGAIVSLLDKELNRELIDTQCPWQLGQFIRERFDDDGKRDFHRDAIRHTTVRNVKLRSGGIGPIWRGTILNADLDGAEPGSAQIEIRLFDTEKRLELHFDIRKLPVREPEGLYVAFPFAWPGGKIIYEAQGGMVVPGENQIPRSASDWQTVQNFAAVRSDAGQIVWGSRDIPLVQFGDLNCGKWQPTTRVDRPHIFSWPMNNYWFTNFNATQQGQFKWSYYLTSTADAGNATATRFGWGSQVPLVARALPRVRSQVAGSVGGASASLLKCDATNLLLVEARPAWHGPGVILQWREVDGTPATLDLAGQPFAGQVTSIDEVNIVEEPVQAGIKSVTFKPYEVKLVRVLMK